eukprot:NODE_1780_length_760_cov_196.679325_g1488_i0.p2 GENE.NODE_1780_length_760_cov_196.679325_g1488_i0~~NODE_1780_length_760_cov_196.679325_g1488_i0.p2  ORF type:complete len:91 (-),score=8.05 NODE_1780_length_760_cov_196.679325_g1488_i0:136-408(-)
MGVLLDYPVGEPDSLEYCLLQEGKSPAWQDLPIEGRWFPDAFIGPMASLMRYIEGSSKELSSSAHDAFKTMAIVEAAYASSNSGGTPIPS